MQMNVCVSLFFGYFIPVSLDAIASVFCVIRSACIRR